MAEMNAVRPGFVASAPRSQRLSPMTTMPEQAAAAQAINNAFARFDMTVFSKPAKAAQELLAIMPVMSPREELLRKLAMDLQREVLRHPEAASGKIFTMRLRNLEGVGLRASALAGAGLTRLVALPVNGGDGVHGNLTPADMDNLTQWIGRRNVLLFTAGPSPYEESGLIDRAEDVLPLSEMQLERLQAIYDRMRVEHARTIAQIQAAGSVDPTAAMGVRNALAQVNTLGQMLKNVQAGRSDATLAQTLRQFLRGVTNIVGVNSLNPALPTSFREDTRANVQDIRATGSLAEKHAPIVVAAPRHEVVAFTPNAEQPQQAVSVAPILSSAPAAVSSGAAPSQAASVSFTASAEAPSAPASSESAPVTVAVAVANLSVEPPKAQETALVQAQEAVPLQARAEVKPAVQVEAQKPAEAAPLSPESKKSALMVRQPSLPAAPPDDKLPKEGPRQFNSLPQRDPLPVFLTPPPRINPLPSSIGGPVLFYAPPIHFAHVGGRDSNSPVKKAFKAAAKGLCEGCGGGNCAECTRGKMSAAKIDAARSALKAKYG